MGWLADKLIGKVDNSPIYQELYDGDRRKPHRCLDWQQKQEAELKRRLEWQANVTRNAKQGEINEQLKRLHYLFLKSKLFELYSPYSCTTEDLVRLDSRLMRALLEYLHPDTSPEGNYWKTVIELVEADPSLKPYVPGLFNGKFVEMWREAKTKRDAEAKQKQIRDQLIKSGRVLKYRISGTTQHQHVGRVSAMLVPGTKREIHQDTDVWENLCNWIDNPNFSTRGTLYVTIEGVGEINAGTFANSFTGSVSFDWSTVWRPA
jgi:hypothetical protein